MELKLEGGRMYVNAEGTAEMVRLVAPGEEFPFEGRDSLMRYKADGRYVDDENSACAVYNLVAAA